jgi:hypothetical protein
MTIFSPFPEPDQATAPQRYLVALSGITYLVQAVFWAMG